VRRTKKRDKWVPQVSSVSKEIQRQEIERYKRETRKKMQLINLQMSRVKERKKIYKLYNYISILPIID